MCRRGKGNIKRYSVEYYCETCSKTEELWAKIQHLQLVPQMKHGWYNLGSLTIFICLNTKKLLYKMGSGTEHSLNSLGWPLACIVHFISLYIFWYYCRQVRKVTVNCRLIIQVSLSFQLSLEENNAIAVHTWLQKSY